MKQNAEIEMEEQAKEEAAAKIMVLRLHPVLHMIRATLHQYKSSHVSTLGNSSTQELSILQSLAHLFQVLKKEFDSFPALIPSEDLVSDCMIRLKDFLALPFLALFKTIRFAIGVSEEEYIVESAKRKVLEHTAGALVSCCQRSSLFPPEWIENLLMVLVNGLPLGRHIMEKQQMNISNSHLDHGEVCLSALFAAIRQLLVCGSGDGTEQVATMLAETDSAGLVARIVDCCIALITPIDSSQDWGSEPWTVELQVDAVETIRCVIDVAPRARAWRSIFPGCFAGLYRRLLLAVRKRRTSHLVTSACKTLTRLLQVTLGTSGSAGDSQVKSKHHVEMLLINLQHLAMASESEEESPVRDEFILQVRERITAPLIVLCRFLVSSSSAAVRQEAIALFGVLLIHTSVVWNTLDKADTRANDLMTTAHESLLVLTRDVDMDVQAGAKNMLKAYYKECGKESTMISVDRVHQMLEELPVLAQSQHQPELRTKIKLLTSYLELCQTSEEHRKRLASSFRSEESQQQLLTTFATLFDVDFESFGTDQSVLVIPQLGSVSPFQVDERNPPLRCLRGDAVDEAYSLAEIIGVVTGPRTSAFLVDACIAGFYEKLSLRWRNKTSLTGPSHRIFLHQHIGMICFARCIMRGAFQGMCGNESQPSKSDGRRSKMFLEVAKAILPLIFSSPMWELPCSMFFEFPEKKGSGLVEGCDSSSSGALRGNVAVTGLMLDLVNSVLELDTAGTLIPTVIYPVLQQAGQAKSPWIQRKALRVLGCVSSSQNLRSIPALLCLHMDTIFGKMLGQLRAPGGSSLSRDTVLDENCLTVVRVATTLLNILNAGEQNKSTFLSDYVDKVIRLILERFDHLSIQLGFEPQIAMAFQQLFIILFCWLLKTSEIPDIREDVSDMHQRHNAIISPFIKDDDLPSKDGTESRGNQQNRTSVSANTALVSAVLSRCSYMLSYSDLTVQTKACQSLVKGFSFLGRVSMTYIPMDDEANGPKTAVLRQVHTLWPAISSRLKATTALVCSTNASLSLIISTTSSETARPINIGEQRIYLGNLLELCSVMAESSDDFMATRFRENVWPCLAQMLGHFVKRQQCELSRSIRKPYSKALAASEKSLVLSVLACLEKVFAHRPLALRLSNLIPTAGTMLFPFLEGFDQDIHSSCERCLKRLIEIDCDALWQPLMELSGHQVPPCPIVFSNRGLEMQLSKCFVTNDFDRKILAKTPISSNLSKACQELLLHLDSLPEQDLDLVPVEPG